MGDGSSRADDLAQAVLQAASALAHSQWQHKAAIAALRAAATDIRRPSDAFTAQVIPALRVSARSAASWTFIFENLLLCALATQAGEVDALPRELVDVVGNAQLRAAYEASDFSRAVLRRLRRGARQSAR